MGKETFTSSQYTFISAPAEDLSKTIVITSVISFFITGKSMRRISCTITMTFPVLAPFNISSAKERFTKLYT